MTNPVPATCSPAYVPKKFPIPCNAFLLTESRSNSYRASGFFERTAILILQVQNSNHCPKL
jgi:hypothetical protein